MLYIILIFFLIILFFPLPKKIFKSNKLDKKLLAEGNWHFVYEENGKIIKVLKGLGDDNDSLPLLYNKSLTCLFSIIVKSIAYHYVWRSHKIKYREFNDLPYFPKIYLLDGNIIIQEKIKKNNYCSKTLKKQIIELNKILNNKNYVLDDIHEENIKMGSDGNIKIIDGEIFTKNEYKIYKNIINFFKKDFIKNYENAKNINYWNDDKISAEQKCSKFM